VVDSIFERSSRRHALISWSLLLFQIGYELVSSNPRIRHGIALNSAFTLCALAVTVRALCCAHELLSMRGFLVVSGEFADGRCNYANGVALLSSARSSALPIECECSSLSTRLELD
jgi:hypothetical protein